MLQNTLEVELAKFGMSSQQIKIYLALVEHKQLRVQEIARITKTPRSSVYEALKYLFELGIAEEIVHENFKAIRPYSVGAMHHGLDEEMLRLRRLKEDLTTLEQTLVINAPKQNMGATSVKYYKGRTGARQLYWNTLKTNGEILVMSDWGRGRYVGMRFYERFVAESRARNVRERVLINPHEYALESIRKYTFPESPISRTRLQDIRAIDTSYIEILGDTLMYDDVFATVYLKQIEISGFEIESEHFAKLQRSMFETLWKLGKPVAKLL